jgi:hypothetical protein
LRSSKRSLSPLTPAISASADILGSSFAGTDMTLNGPGGGNVVPSFAAMDEFDSVCLSACRLTQGTRSSELAAFPSVADSVTLIARPFLIEVVWNER